jgi:hypothetical protein
MRPVMSWMWTTARGNTPSPHLACPRCIKLQK